MINVHDRMSGELYEYEDSYDMSIGLKSVFDSSVHAVIDEMITAYNSNGYTGEYEAFLGIEIS